MTNIKLSDTPTYMDTQKNITFYNESHSLAYMEWLLRDKTHPHDNERHALFYLLALCDTTKNHIEAIYNFTEHIIEPECLNEPWQTGSSTRLTFLAFNLFNNHPSDYSPLDLFANHEYLPYFCEALSIRFH